jgi:hypothetical protein
MIEAYGIVTSFLLLAIFQMAQLGFTIVSIYNRPLGIPILEEPLVGLIFMYLPVAFSLWISYLGKEDKLKSPSSRLGRRVFHLFSEDACKNLLFISIIFFLVWIYFTTVRMIITWETWMSQLFKPS